MNGTRVICRLAGVEICEEKVRDGFYFYFSVGLVGLGLRERIGDFGVRA